MDGGGVGLHTFSATDSYEGDVDNLTSETTYVNQAGGTKVDYLLQRKDMQLITASLMSDPAGAARCRRRARRVPR